MNDTEAEVLQEAWRRIWVQRFDKEADEYAGPDSFYGGITKAAATIAALAKQRGVPLHPPVRPRRRDEA